MAGQITFCGQCGAHLPAGAGFCGKCGAQVRKPEGSARRRSSGRPVIDPSLSPGRDEADAAKQSIPGKQAPAAPLGAGRMEERLADSAARTASMGVSRPAAPATGGPVGAGLHWAIVWALGWLPAGLFMGWFWTTNRQLNLDFYETYAPEVLWGYTYPGAASAFTLAGAVGGALSGLLLGALLPHAAGTRGAARVLVLWWLGWAVALGPFGAVFLSGGPVTDDTLFFVILAGGPFLAALAALVVISANARSGGRISAGKRLLAAVACAIFSIAGLLATVLVIEL